MVRGIEELRGVGGRLPSAAVRFVGDDGCVQQQSEKTRLESGGLRGRENCRLPDVFSQSQVASER